MKQSALDLTVASKGITRTILLLAWPVLVEQIFTTLISYADTAMVGSLGASATAAVSISNSVIFLLNSVIMAISVGITALVARACGEGDDEQVRSLIRHAVMLILIIGIPIMLISVALHRAIPKWMGAEPDVLELAARYNLIVGFGRFFYVVSNMMNASFRGYGDTKTPLVINSTMNIVNVIFNFFLIYPTRTVSLAGCTLVIPGAGLGVEGAAYATAIGMLVSGLLALGMAFLRPHRYRISLRDSWKLNCPLTKQIMSISAPMMLERICMSSSGILTSATIATLGTAVVAANSLQLTAESMSYMPAFAFQTAITTLVGQSLGAKKPELAMRYTRVTLLLGSALMVLTGSWLFVCGRGILSFFTSDAEVITIGADCLKVVAFMQVPQVIGWTLSGVLHGAGDTKSSFYITAGTQWAIRTVFTIVVIRVFGLGLVAVQYVILVEIIARTILFYFRYRSRKWVDVFERQNKAAG